MIINYMDMNSLQYVFEKAIRDNHEYIALKISMPEYDNCEIIINSRNNFKTKLDYYKKAYNHDLTLKTFNKIKIIDAAYGSLQEIKVALMRD